MKNNEPLRGKLLITQLEFAGYLGVSRTLLTLHEKGLRSLPTAALTKLTDLEIFFRGLKHKKAGEFLLHPRIQKHNETTKKELLEQSVLLRHKKLVAERALAVMKENHEKVNLWLELVNNYMAGLSGLPKEDLPWFENQKYEAARKIIRYGEAAQARLLVKIRAWEAQEIACKKACENL